MSANHVLNRLAWTIVLSLACLSNARAEPLPEFYGVYAVDGGQIHELKFEEGTKWQRSVRRCESLYLTRTFSSSRGRGPCVSIE